MEILVLYFKLFKKISTGRSWIFQHILGGSKWGSRSNRLEPCSHMEPGIHAGKKVCTDNLIFFFYSLSTLLLIFFCFTPRQKKVFLHNFYVSEGIFMKISAVLHCFVWNMSSTWKVLELDNCLSSVVYVESTD